MTLIAAVGFSEEVIVICDSRMSYKNNVEPASDNLKKIYQLSSHSLITYTTEDVKLTHKLIEKITLKSLKYQKLRTEDLLKKITNIAMQEYESLTASKDKPIMEIIYAAMINKPYVVPRDKLYSLLKHKENRFFPDKLKIDLDKAPKKVSIDPPTPLLIKQVFPSGLTISTNGWDYTADGSGKGFIDEIEKFYTKLFFFPGGSNKGIILSDLCEGYMKDKKIESIGGTVQVFQITKDGVSPVMYQEGNKRKKYIDQNGDWIEEDLTTGEKKKVTQKPYS